MKRFLPFIGLLAIAGCFKDVEVISGPQIDFSGKAIDDKTGQPIINAKISVVGHNNSGGVWFGTSERADLGSVLTDSRGNFNLRFKKWDAAQTFEFFAGDAPGYFINYFTLEANEVHSVDTVIQFTRETIFDIHFKNTSPVDVNDSLSFFIYGTEREYGYTNTTCTITMLSGIANTGGYIIQGNAEGTKRCPAAADRKYYINYRVRKGAIVTIYWDSVFCARDVINTYNLNY